VFRSTTDTTGTTRPATRVFTSESRTHVTSRRSSAGRRWQGVGSTGYAGRLRLSFKPADAAGLVRGIERSRVYYTRRGRRIRQCIPDDE
jgi:hypothetical protein